MPRRRAREGHSLSAEINVTSLVDVALTLLVIFMITAPIMQGGVEVKVPHAQTGPIESPEGVIVTVTKEGDVYVGDSKVGWSEFPAALTDVVRKKQARNLYVKADEAVPYGRVIQVLGAMKALDIGSVGLVAEPEEGAGGRAGR